jgi:predicted 3-demethylubiquinone-9 3-methyltransferase (glyoxalase superfamily)
MAKNAICLWYDGTAEDAAKFYAQTFPDSAESACGWCKDRWGLSWQITPRALLDAMNDPDRAAAKRSFEVMMTMRKIDIGAIEAARRGTARA